MRVVLATYGTTGDVQPVLALARELQRRGHTAIFAAPPNFEARSGALDIEFSPLGPFIEKADLHRAFVPTLGMVDAADQARHNLSEWLPFFPRMFEELSAVCRRADVLVCVPYQLAGLAVRDKTGIPYVSLHFSPFGGVGNRQFIEATAPLVNAYRAELGLGPLRDPLGADATSSQLALYAVSAHVVRRPIKWPAHCRITGYFFLDEPWEPDARLSAFLAAGQRPVVITFGSVLHAEPEATTRLLLDAVERVRCRAIIQHGWSGLARGQLPDGVIGIDFAPHGWLFEHARCVVHAGGAGTTAAAFRAGAPAVVVPHVLDQPIWGQVARELKCAAGVIPFAQLTADRLALALESALASDRYANAAAELASRIHAEDGVATAADLIEELA